MGRGSAKGSGVEALVRFRDLVERAAKSGVIDPLISIDVHLVNAFCMLEWEPMRADVEKAVPEILPWLRWQ